MSYELRHGETLGDNLRRICCKQIEDAIAIAKGEEKTDDTPVHEMRKHLKKARGALRLVRKEIGRGLFRKQDRGLRDVGRLTSEIRDAEVRLQTVRQLQEVTQRHRRNAYGKLEAMLTLELENFMAAFAEWQTQAVPLLEHAGSSLDHWTLDQFNSKQLRRAPLQIALADFNHRKKLVTFALPFRFPMFVPQSFAEETQVVRPTEQIA